MEKVRKTQSDGDRKDSVCNYDESVPDSSGERSPVRAMEQYRQVIDTRLSGGRFYDAWMYIQASWQLVRGKEDPYLLGLYYSLESDFYDARLNGNYAMDNEYREQGIYEVIPEEWREQIMRAMEELKKS